MLPSTSWTFRDTHSSGGTAVIPHVDPDTKLLPPGAHECTVPEIVNRFVVGAPHEARRKLLMSALNTYMQIVRSVLPGVRFWIDGSFVSHQDDPPNDVDVLLVVDPAIVGDPSDYVLVPLLTMFNFVANLGEFRVVESLQVQPIGGLIDGFIATVGDPSMERWRRRWSEVRDQDGEVVPGALKGFLEVAS